MGKNRHSKDRLYLTATEWKGLGGKNVGTGSGASRPLPFDHCALTLTRFGQHPVCTPQGVVFDILNIVPYLKRHDGLNPVDGLPLDRRQLIRLTFHKNADGKYFCPVTYKVFNANSHIVAVKTSGNVFSWEAVQELNIRQKNWCDLVSGEDFKRGDVIEIQDPSNRELCAARDIVNFTHLEEVRREEAAKRAAVHNPTANIRHSSSTEGMFKQIAEKRKRVREEAAAAEAEASSKKKGKRVMVTADSTAARSGSFTSTAMSVSSSVTMRAASDKEIREAHWRRIKSLRKKGYVRLHTSLGDLNVELHCDIVPRTCDNFLGLCRRGFYDRTLFHRVIRNFMAQGGDPTGTGTGGESLWGGAFDDEFESRMVHSGRGVLSMANSGPNTNRSQFFVAFKSCEHLDNVHSVFGQVVGGGDVLSRLEASETDGDDRPLCEATITRVTIFVDPSAEADALRELEEAEEEERERREQEEAARRIAVRKTLVAQRHQPAAEAADRMGGGGGGKKKNAIGRYLQLPSSGSSAAGAGRDNSVARKRVSKKAAPSTTSFGKFSGW